MPDPRFILFRIRGESFLADVLTVRQIAPWSAPRPVPNAPPTLAGVMIFGEKAVPVLDLSTQLPAAPDPVSPHGLMMLLETASGTIALKVDEVKKIIPLNLDEIVPAPPLVQSLSGDLLAGIVRRSDEQYLILDLERLLEPETMQEVRELCENESRRESA